MSDVSELVAGLRRRRENDDYALEAVRETASHPSGIFELHGVIFKANVDRSHAADALETLAGENAELNTLFDLQYTRMDEAMQLWRRETGRENVSPDLGRLLEWLMERYAKEVLVSEYRLAKLAPVVEAARGIQRAEAAKDQKEWVACHDAMYSAIATLEAAHD